MGGYNTCIYLGMMLSSAIMGAVSEAIGFTAGFLLTAGVNLAFLGLFCFLFKNDVSSRGAAVA
jgi:predicted MFS family arabinose efflux permease